MHGKWLKIIGVLFGVPGLLVTLTGVLYWQANQVFATDDELNSVKKELSAQISNTETNIICGGIDLQIIQLKAEQKALLKMDLDLGAVDKHVLNDLNDQWDKRCDGGPHR